jgi:hypothetical protein
MKITNIQYHRNGSGTAEGFTQVLFHHNRTDKNLMALVFSSQIAVINLDDPTAKFNGDYYLPWIRAAIAAWEESWDSAQAAYAIKFPFTVR